MLRLRGLLAALLYHFQTILFVLDVWQCRDEHNNFQQKYDAELIKEAKRFVHNAVIFLFRFIIVTALFCSPRLEVEIEVRKNVDELMREELKNLKMVYVGAYMLNNHRIVFCAQIYANIISFIFRMFLEFLFTLRPFIRFRFISEMQYHLPSGGR